MDADADLEAALARLRAPAPPPSTAQLEAAERLRVAREHTRQLVDAFARRAFAANIPTSELEERALERLPWLQRRKRTAQTMSGWSTVLRHHRVVYRPSTHRGWLVRDDVAITPEGRTLLLRERFVPDNGEARLPNGRWTNRYNSWEVADLPPGSFRQESDTGVDLGDVPLEEILAWYLHGRGV